MTDPLLAPARSGRRVFAVAVAGLLGALATSTMIAPGRGTAAPVACDRVAGTASADVVNLRLLDLSPLGAPLPAVTDITLASTRAGLAGGARRTAARSEYVRGNVLGLRAAIGPLGARAYQQAPPNAPRPDRANPGRVDLGVARAGTGDLIASATYADARRCDSRAGATATSSAALLDAAVLPTAGGGGLLRIPRSISTTAHTTLVSRPGGRSATEASAAAGLADLTVLDTVSVRVLSQPKLRVLATGAVAGSVVEYSAPVLEVNLPDAGKVQLDGARGSVDIAVPTTTGGPVAEGLPVLPGNPLGALLSTLRSTPGLNGGTAAAPEALVPGLSGLPALPGLLGGLIGGRVPDGVAAVAVLRLSVGELTREIANSGVHARAVSLRLRLVLLRVDGAETTLVDLCVGVLEAAASAPATGSSGGGYGEPSATAGGSPTNGPSSSSSPTPSGSASGGGGGSGEGTPNLPVTGFNLALFLGGGVGLMAAGRFLLLIARRRATGLDGLA